MLKKINNLLIIMGCIILLYSCTPEEFKTDGIRMDEINPEYAIPLVNDELSLDDLIKSGDMLRKDKDGFLSLVYRGQIFSSTAGEAVNIPDQNFSPSIALTSGQATALTSGQSQTITLQSNQSFALSGREIDSIWLKAGKLVASISSEIRTSGNLKITFQDAKKLGIVLSLDVPFTYGGSIPVLASNNIDLAAYKWNMSTGGAGYNNVNLKLELTLNPTTETVTAGDKMDISIGFNAMKFYRFYGYIGQVNLVNASDTIPLDIFDKAKDGQFTLEDPRVKIISGNSFGVPVKAGFTQLRGITKGSLDVAITGFPDPLPINVPNASQIGQMVYDSATINKMNSNIRTVINQKPKQVFFECYVNLNPNGKTQRNFVSDNSQIKFVVEVELPLDGSARNFVLENETDINFKMPSEDLIERMTMRFTANNGYPIDLATQMYLMDSLGVTFDSIFSSQDYKIMSSAQVGTDGKVISPTRKTTEITFDLLRSKRLSRLKKVKLRAELGTTSNGGTYPSVKLYSTYLLGITVGLKAKLKLNQDVLDSLGKK